MKKVLALLSFCTLLFQSYCQSQTPDSLQQRIILIGDGGELASGRQPVIWGIRNTIPFDKKTTIVFLGDNLYQNGLPDESVAGYNTIKAPLDSQIIIANGTDAKVYFIPGNHDWNNGYPGGWESIQREQAYIDNFGSKNVEFFPKDGCPGPELVNLTPDIALIIMDSQWWLHPYDKPGIESDCPYKTKAQVLTQLDDLLSKNSKKLVLFALHHTFRSYGIHGGYFTLKQYIFPLTDVNPKLYIPLPVIGSVYPITRKIFGTTEDMSHPLYESMIADIEKVIKVHHNVIYVAGHEHTLQLIKDSGYYYVVSGAASKSTRVSKGKNSLFASDKKGFAILDVSKNKNVSASFYTVDSEKVKQEFNASLFNFSSLPTPENPNDTSREAEIVFNDNAIISASDKYKSATGFKQVFLGDNYRKEWSTPITLKVFNLRRSGLHVVSMGGGKQTKSLRLKDKNDKEWTLRSIDKDPEKAIPQNLRHTLAQGIVQYLISASYPYAPYIVPGLSQATGVSTTHPQFYYVPDDPAFGIYRTMFKNTVCLLEERDPTADAKDTKTTAKVINKIIDDHDNHVDEVAYLKARLLDNVIGDWDRHFDQWKWVTTDTGKGKLYYPVPRDRDQAFYNSDGLLINYLAKNQYPYLQGFKKNFRDIRWFNYESRDIDRIFMTRLNETDWRNTIAKFQQDLTDKSIDSSVKKLPPEIYSMDAQTITDKLKIRRDELMTQGIKFYKFLSKDVNIIGSNNQEYFKVQNKGDSLQVIVYRKGKKGDSTGIIYNRSFHPSVTKEIRLYGLNGNDKFEIAENTNSKIKVRMIGGKGNDTFNIKGNVRNYVYDLKNTDSTYEKNGIINSNKTKVDLSTNPLVNEYRPYGYNYNIYRFPQLNVAYNEEDKLLVGFGFSAKTFGFRKEPYSTYQKLATLYSPAHGAYQIKYQGIFNSVFLNKDIILNAEMVNPTLNNFFGLGNTTVFDKTKPLEYYRVRYKYIQTELLLRKGFNNHVLDVSFGPSYYHYWNKYSDNKSRILGTTPFLIDSANVYSNKDYLGGKLRIDINFINDELIPSRGVIWLNEFSSMVGLNSNSNNITKFTSDMTVYASMSEERKFVTVLKFGGGHIFSKNFEFFQALNLGANNILRGFRKQRFSGSSTHYASAEERIKIFKSKSYILPGDVGVIGFYDVGKIWMQNQSSKQWHQSYGGGFYYSPFNIVVLSATIGFSDEDKLFNFSLGTKFRLTF
ncbi:MAG: metallophosphoesterase [Bacteroidota bacterium]|nr:metallophosphoesterase [Bacteroidota bacterium]